MSMYDNYFKAYNAEQLLRFWDWFIAKRNPIHGYLLSRGAVRAYEQRFDELATHIRMYAHGTFEGTSIFTDSCPNSGVPR